jgi:hypothetical protein
MKLFRTLALIGAGLLVRKFVGTRASGSRTAPAKSDGFGVDTRPMAYPRESDATPDASPMGPGLAGQPVHP